MQRGKERIGMYTKPLSTADCPLQQSKLQQKIDSPGKSRCSMCSAVSVHPHRGRKNRAVRGGALS